VKTAVSVVRPGVAIGQVGVPHYGPMDLSKAIFYQNVIVVGDPPRCERIWANSSLT
jgi:hypothetical protein